jgi:pimeloyl-ACP methyl ester carboxylesterase
MLQEAIRLTAKTIRIAGIDLDVFETGHGAPLLWLHGAPGFNLKHEFVDLVAARRRLIAPSPPGFGKSGLPDWLDSVDDVTHVYLELLDRLELRETDVVGTSLGGWIAADMASKVPERIRKLVLVGPVGVKVGSSDKLDIPDIFAMPQDQVNKLIYHDPEKMTVDLTKLSDDELAGMFRNRETLALLVWEPWMHNPKLKHRLHRAAMPTLFVRGESDGLVSAEYLAGYAKLFPKARTMTIPKAGHAPQQEQPQALVKAVLEFLDG